MAIATSSEVSFGLMMLALLMSASGALVGDVAVSETGLPQGVRVDPSNSSSFSATSKANAALLTFRLRFTDGPAVPLAQAQLLSQGGSQSNTTRNDGSCSFQVDPSKAHSLLLSALGSANSAGSIPLNRAIAIPPFDAAAFNGVRDLGRIVIPFVSFCSGTLAYGSDNGGFIAGSDPLHTLQAPGRTCIWNLGPFPGQSTIALYVQWFDVSSGDVMTVTATKQDGSAPQVVLQLDLNMSAGQTDYLAISVPASQATIVLATGRGPEALTYGFVMYYRVNYMDDASPLLTVSLVWAAGGCLIIVIVFLVVIILKRRQRQRGPLSAPTLLPWDRAKMTPVAVPDPLNHDVMVVTWPGGGARRVALPQKVWRANPKSYVETPAPCFDTAEPPLTAVGSYASDSSLTQHVRVFDRNRPAEARSSLNDNPVASCTDPKNVMPVSSNPLPASESVGAETAGRVETGDVDCKDANGSDERCGARSNGEAADGWNKVQNEAENAADTCAICLVEYEEGTLLRPLLCAHAFHTACIDTWLKKDPSCPLCKRPLCSGVSTSKSSDNQGLELGQLPAASSQPGPSNGGADAGRRSTGPDLEAGESTVSRRSFSSGGPVDSGSIHEAYERAELDERADRQRASNAPWYMHQWLAWGW